MDELLTIHAFAEIVGVKPQGIYKQATNENSRLYKYVVLQKGKRYIKKSALWEVYQIDQTNQETETDKQNQGDNQTNTENQPNQTKQPNETTATNQGNAYDELIEFLKQELADRKEELKTRDKQIENLTRLLDQEQHLHAQTKLLVREYQEKEEVETEGVKEEVAEAPQEVKQEKKKRSRLYRWFFGED